VVTRGADVLLAIVVRALPPHRREWGRAMRSELAVLTERRARLRFVGGCARATLIRWPAARAVMAYACVLTFAVVTLRQAASLSSAGVRVEASVLVGAIVVLAWLGRRHGAVGPVDNTWSARGVRLAGYLVVMATVAALFTMGTNDPEGWWLAALAVGLYLASLLRLTAHPTTGALSLPTAALLTLAGLAVWWTLALLLPAVRAVPAITFLAALVVAAVGVKLGARTGSASRGVFTGLAAAAALLLLTFLAAVLTYQVAPGLVPDIAPATLDAATRAETNQIESIDPYVADFLIGAILAIVVATISAQQARSTSIMKPPAEPATLPAAPRARP
jgi:hypothetical protein